MADPLSAVADRFVPPKTNFLDPAPGQSIIARYGNAGVGLDDSDRLAESAIRLRRAREDRLAGGRETDPFELKRQARQEMLWDEEDRRAKQKEDELALKGEFLDMLNNNVDPEAEDYDDQIVEFYKQLPKAVAEDESTKAAIAFKNRKADAARQRRDSERAKQVSYQNQLKLIQARAEHSAGLKGLTQEDYNAATVDGELDLLTLGMLAGQRQRENQKADTKERMDYAQNQKKEMQQIRTSAQAAQRVRDQPIGKDVEAALGNVDVFPTQMEALRRANPKKDDAWLKKNKAEEYGKAREYDSKQLEAELGSAWNRKTEDEYVELVPGLKPEQKELRRKVYRAAQEAFGGSTPMADEVKDYEPPKDQFEVGKRYRDGKGNVRVYKGDGKWE